MKSQHHQQPNTNQTHTQNRTILGQNQHTHTTGRSRNPYIRIPKTHTHLIGKQQGFTYPDKAGKKTPTIGQEQPASKPFNFIKNHKSKTSIVINNKPVIELKHKVYSLWRFSRKSTEKDGEFGHVMLFYATRRKPTRNRALSFAGVDTSAIGRKSGLRSSLGPSPTHGSLGLVGSSPVLPLCSPHLSGLTLGLSVLAG
jgi:hypothetical protein